MAEAVRRRCDSQVIDHVSDLAADLVAPDAIPIGRYLGEQRPIAMGCPHPQHVFPEPLGEVRRQRQRSGPELSLEIVFLPVTITRWSGRTCSTTMSPIRSTSCVVASSGSGTWWCCM